MGTYNKSKKINNYPTTTIKVKITSTYKNLLFAAYNACKLNWDHRMTTSKTGTTYKKSFMYPIHIINVISSSTKQGNDIYQHIRDYILTSAA